VSDFEFGLLYSFCDPPQWQMGYQRVYAETV
jgi:hypothetical protein